jgi:hypothetical protein
MNRANLGFQVLAHGNVFLIINVMGFIKKGVENFIIKINEKAQEMSYRLVTVKK